MVFQDLSRNSMIETHSRTGFLAPPSDRVLAFLFDVIFLSPVFALVLGGLLKKIDFQLMTSPGDTAFWILVGLCALLGGVLSIFIQSLFLALFGATPGKLIFKMRVLSLSGQKITWGQSFLRSFMWTFEWGLLGLPFLEIFGQAQRRPIHDRCADTIVVTLKKSGDTGPVDLEIQFVRQILLGLGSVGLIWGGIAATRVYLKIADGELKRQELIEAQYLCSNVGESHDQSVGSVTQQRLDRVIAKFMMAEVDEKCLLQEIDFAFWTQEKVNLAWAYLAQAIYYEFDKDKRKTYLSRVCGADEQGSSGLSKGSKSQVPCLISRFLIERDGEEFRSGGRTDQLLVGSATWNVLKLIQVGSVIDSPSEESRKLAMDSSYREIEEKLARVDQILPGSEFVQTQRIKLFWNRKLIERAYGAYAMLSERSKVDPERSIQSWMCLRELDQGCGQQERPACLDLRNHWKAHPEAPRGAEQIVALMKDRNCRGVPEPTPLSFHQFLKDQPQYRDFLAAVSADSGWGENQRLRRLRELTTEAEAAPELRQLAVRELKLKNQSADSKNQIGPASRFPASQDQKQRPSDIDRAVPE